MLRFIGEKNPEQQSNLAQPSPDFFARLGQRIDQRLEKTHESQVQRQRYMHEAARKNRDMIICQGRCR